MRTKDLSLQQKIPISKHSNEILNRNSRDELHDEFEELQKLLYFYAEQFYQQTDFEYRNSELLYPILFPLKETKELKDILNADGKRKSEKNKKYKKRLDETEDIERSIPKNEDSNKLLSLKTTKTKSFQQVSLREITDVLAPVNKKISDMLFLLNHHQKFEKYLKSGSAFETLCKKDIEIDARSSQPLLMFGCCRENSEDVKKAVDRILQKLKDTMECRNICGCPLKNSCKITCIRTPDNIRSNYEDKESSYTEMKRKYSKTSLEEGKQSSRNYEDKKQREQRIRELLEKMMGIIRSSCIIKSQVSEEKISDSFEHMKAKEKIIDEKNFEQETRIISITNYNLNEETIEDETISDKPLTVDEEKRKERANKLIELVRVIMMKKKCVCRENIEHEETMEDTKICTDIVENSSIRSRESSDISIEALNRELSITSTSRKSSKKVSFLDDNSETNAKDKLKNIETQDTNLPKVDTNASTISIKISTSSSQSLKEEDTVENSSEEKESMVSEEIESSSIEKVDASTSTENLYLPNNEIVENDTYPTRKTDRIEKKKMSSDEEYFDTSEKKTRSSSRDSSLNKYEENKRNEGKKDSENEDVEKDKVSTDSISEKICGTVDADNATISKEGIDSDKETMNIDRKNSKKFIRNASICETSLEEKLELKKEQIDPKNERNQRSIPDKRSIFTKYLQKNKGISKTDLDFNKMNSNKNEKPLTAPLIRPIQEHRGFERNEISKTKKEMVNQNDISIDIKINLNESRGRIENKMIQTKKRATTASSVEKTSKNYSSNINQRTKRFHSEEQNRSKSEVDMKNNKEEEKKQKDAGKLWKSGRYARRDNINKKEPIPSSEQKTVITMKNKDNKKKTINEVEGGAKSEDQQLIWKLKSILEKKKHTKMEMNKQDNIKKKEQETFETEANLITNLSDNRPKKNKRTTRISYHHEQPSSKSTVNDKRINKLDIKRTDPEQKTGYKVKHKTIKKYMTPPRKSSIVKSNTKKDSIKLSTSTGKHEAELEEFHDENSQNIPKKHSKHKQFSVVKLTQPAKDQILYDTKFTDTAMDKSASLRKKTEIERDKYISPYSAKGTSSFIPNVRSNEIERKMRSVVKNISCETIDSLFGLGYLLEGKTTECKDKKLETFKEEKTNKTPPIYGETMTKPEIRLKPKIDIQNKEKQKYAPLIKHQVISQEKIMQDVAQRKLDGNERKIESKSEIFIKTTRSRTSRKQDIIIENKKNISITKNNIQNGIIAGLGKSPAEKPLNNIETSKIHVKQSNIKHEENGKSNSRHSSVFVRGVDLSISRHHKKRTYSISLNDQFKNSIMDTQMCKRKHTKDKDYMKCNEKKLNMDTESLSFHKEKNITDEVSKRPTKTQDNQQKNFETLTKNINDSLKDEKLKENKFKHTNKEHSYPNVRLKAQKIVDSLLEDSIKAIEQGRRKLGVARNSKKNIRIENENNETKQHKISKPEQHDENDKNKINYVQKEKIDLNESKTPDLNDYSKIKESKSGKHFKGEITESKKQETDQNSEQKLIKHKDNKETPDVLVPKRLDGNTDSKPMKSSDKKMCSVHVFKPSSSVKNGSNIEESTDARKDSKVIISTKRTDPQKLHQKRDIDQYALKFVDDILKEGLKKAREKIDTRGKSRTEKISDSKTSKSDSNEDKLNEIRRKKMKPEKSPDRKLSWADDEMKVAKLAKYADILEDISLDRAEEMEDLLSKPSPAMKRKCVDCSKRKCSNESSKYKMMDIEDAWSSSSLKTPIQCCKKTTDGSSTSICHGPLDVFKRRTNIGERKLFVPSSKQDVRGRKVDRTSIRVSVVPQEPLREISSDCCGNIELKRVRGIQSIHPCHKHISPSSLISRSKIRDDSGNVCVSINASEETQKVQSNIKIFTRRRRYLEIGKCIKVPSALSGSFRSRKKFSDNATYDESLSNVLGPIVTSTESDVSNKFFSACDISLDQSLCGCAVAENVIEGTKEESWSNIRCSKASKNFSGTTEKENRINISSSSKNFRKKLTRSVSDKIDLRRILEGENSSDLEENIVGCTFQNSNGKDKKESRRTSDRSVRFEQCIDLRQKETNSLNLRRERTCKECELNERSTNNICSGSGTLAKKRMSVSLPQFPCSMSREPKIDETKGIEPFFSDCNKYFATYYSENLLENSFPGENRQISSFSLMMFGDETINIGNFNTEIIKAVKDKENHRSQISGTFLKQNESLQSISRCLQGARNGFGNIISYLSFGKTETINDFLFSSSFSLGLSKSFTLDKNCFSALLDILTTSEQQILNVKDSTNFNEQFLQGYTFNNKKISYHQKNAIFSKSEKDELENFPLQSVPHSYSRSDFTKIPKKKDSKTIKIKRKSRRKLFDRYEKQRSILLRKERKTKDEVYWPVIHVKRKTEKSSGSERDVSLHKSSTFYSKTALGSSSDIEKVKPEDIRRLSSAKMKSDLLDPAIFQAKTFIVPERSLKHPPNDIIHREYNKNTSSIRDLPNPYKNDQFIYHASVEVQPEEIKESIPSKEPKRKLNCKEATKKMFQWFKTLGVSQKTAEVAKKKAVDPLLKTELNLLKQRKVLRSKLRYPKANTSTLYIHKREYNQIEQDTIRIPLFGRIDPVLREIPSSEIIEPQLDEEDLEMSSSEEDLGGERKRDRQKDGRLIVFSEDSMVLFERKKVYDRLQRYGKLFYTIYLNEEEDDMDHVSIRSAESVEHRIECEDKPFFATYDLGTNDVRVHVTKDTFEGKRREAIYKEEKFVECQNSQVKLSLMRGKRYLNDLDPTKAKIIEIDCTNQFSEIKICYRKTEKSEECVCEQPDTCKAVQLESSELSSVDINREDKSQETRELCENCEECQEKPETCENYDECTKGNVCSMKKKSTLRFEEVNTIQFCRIPQEFGFPRNGSEGESDGYETDSSENDLSKDAPRRPASKRSRQKYRYSRSRRRHCSKAHSKKR